MTLPTYVDPQGSTGRGRSVLVTNPAGFYFPNPLEVTVNPLRKALDAFSLSVPSMKWVNDTHKALKYTPDVWFLEQFQYHHVFIYGPEQLDHLHHRRIVEDGFFTGNIGYTCEPYALWKKRLGKESFAIPLDEEVGKIDGHEWGNEFAAASKQPIRGEIHTLTMDQIISLDEHYRNTVQFSRRRVLVSVPYRLLYETGATKLVTEKFTSIIPVNMYVGMQGYWENTFANSDNSTFTPVRLYEPPKDSELKKHYHFGTIEYEDY